MSLQAIVLLSGAAGGIAWAGITIAATAWFNRRIRRGVNAHRNRPEAW